MAPLPKRKHSKRRKGLRIAERKREKERLFLSRAASAAHIQRKLTGSDKAETK